MKLTPHRTPLGLLLLTCLIGVLLALVDRSTLSAQTPSENYADRPPRQCRRCHAEEYRTWAESAHALTYESETFQKVWERSRQKPECLACHSPGYNTATGKLRYEGVGCAACHQTLEIERRQGDGRTYHGKLSLGGDSAVCATCHGADHALTFVEWQASPHNGARPVLCLDCHSAHSTTFTTATSAELCASCHLQEVPTVNPHMHVDGNCQDCHPAPVNTDNVHMHGGEPAADCATCHMATELDEYGRYLVNAGHSMEVSLTACTNCHGSLHDLTTSDDMP